MSDADVMNLLQRKGNIRQLKGDGDFRSEECIKYLLIGNQNALTYKAVFPHIKNGEAWIGYRFGDMAFKVPNDTLPRKTRFWIDEEGQKWRSLGNAMWLTNLDNKRKHKTLKLTCNYDPERYPKYDNYDAINVSKVSEIPMNYKGLMGVPLTFLKHHWR